MSIKISFGLPNGIRNRSMQRAHITSVGGMYRTRKSYLRDFRWIRTASAKPPAVGAGAWKKWPLVLLVVEAALR